MSEIKEIKDINPYGNKDNILQIDIDNPKDVYMLKRAIKSEGDYTFSIWYKSDSDWSSCVQPQKGQTLLKMYQMQRNTGLKTMDHAGIPKIHRNMQSNG